MRRASLGRDNGLMGDLATGERVTRTRTAASAATGTVADYDARASDADRERVIDVLKAAFAEGRLTREDLGARAEGAYSARTSAELAALSADLPAGPVGPLPTQADAIPGGRVCAAASRRTCPLAVASVVCGLIPFLPATLAAIILGVAARRQIQRTGEGGDALATAGVALGALWIVLTVIALLVLR
jgi:Domain of unknown function (DUF1707)/Domain of unknown function (DUF4190)